MECEMGISQVLWYSERKRLWYLNLFEKRREGGIFYDTGNVGG